MGTDCVLLIGSLDLGTWGSGVSFCHVQPHSGRSVNGPRSVIHPSRANAGFMIRRAIQSSCGSRRRIDGERVAPACERTKVCA